MAHTTELQKSKQAIIDDFNQALALMDTTSEEVRLRGIVNRSFRKSVSLQCSSTQDIALMHQYYLLRKGHSTAHLLALAPDSQSSAAAAVYAVYNGRQCYGGAEVLPQGEEVMCSAKLSRYNMTIKEAGITENALAVQHVVLSEIHQSQSAKVLLSALVNAAGMKALPSLCITGDTNNLRQLQKAAKAMIAMKLLKRATLFALEDEFNDQSVLHVLTHTVH